MSIVKRALVITAFLVSAGAPSGAFAVDRATCLESCKQTAIDCEERRCGTEEPVQDSDCPRLCGERYKNCKQQCPE